MHGDQRVLTGSGQLAGFAALSGIVISEWISEGGLGGGVGSGTSGSPITLNQSADLRRASFSDPS